ncbi:polyhydroxyalkanoate depolymerase [Rhodoblastus acidophilus]|uniref:Polyhydroxyalkanoate depolymerase n=1 Tax=Candidatus Rhodoblastus alkanivorans TaxID=2954117 RepID=A0ABS9ZAA8_9HYPH|nr:polyhydroxyalkanoate depolymerase [Candidatus Rhodoblastus alkanivorans]MCI4677226.1 polyhydroxyalkanoate depolymerase [Candidatus Rhodoblastus alkanivorans]MCI4684578.1 polyhydroxyalkanoate depolymerase [Candidatus Rhodoblastus alkanivorans]MDI4641900.1 polyhydroxyalkanoate depolymerase [Rhodoblastus acidophilus]
MNHYAYHFYEMAHLAMAPARALSDLTRLTFKNPANPMAYTPLGRNLAASAELFERLTRRYGKPAFGLDKTIVNGKAVAVEEEIVWVRPFCQLRHFRRHLPPRTPRQSRLLIVAPMSGHYATLLRGTVETFLPTHDVFVTDWVDARLVPLSAGRFDLDDYIDYVVEMCEFLDVAGAPPVHLLAVCQPSVPALAAVARMEAEKDPHVPASMTLMGGPIDTRRSPTAVNKVAEKRGSQWFRRNCIHVAPFPYPGAGREVYPGFLQLSGFMAMNLDRHVNAHVDMFNHLIKGDGDSAVKHREFYDEYLAVMDLTAEFYLQTIDKVFVHHELPRGVMTHRGHPVDPCAIRRVGLMTVEGEKDDISGVGQTEAAQDLCCNIPDGLRMHYLQKDVGHYGVFNGSRFRKEIAPRICAFHAEVEARFASDPGLRSPAAVSPASESRPQPATAPGARAMSPA